MHNSSVVPTCKQRLKVNIFMGKTHKQYTNIEIKLNNLDKRASRKLYKNGKYITQKHLLLDPGDIDDVEQFDIFGCSLEDAKWIADTFDESFNCADFYLIER